MNRFSNERFLDAIDNARTERKDRAPIVVDEHPEDVPHKSTLTESEINERVRLHRSRSW